MTVEVEVPTKSYAYTGPGDYSFNYKAPDATDIKVQYTTEGGAEIELTAGIDYTIAISPGITGGVATMTYAATDGFIEIYRETPESQETDLINNDPLDMNVLERAYDKLTMILQEQGLDLDTIASRFIYRGVWVAGVTYQINDIVQYPDSKGNWYANPEVHTSAVPFTEGDPWILVLDVNSVYQDVLRAELAADAAEAAAVAAAASELLASQWADNPEGDDVVPGRYSAMHWAIKAQQAAGGGGVSWFHPYVQGTYPVFTMVRELGWTMIANKETAEYPAPVPTGSPFLVYEGIMSSDSATVKHIIFGSRYSFSQSGYINSYQVYTVIGNEYEVYVVTDPLTNPVQELLLSFTAEAGGWENKTAKQVLLDANVTFDLIVNVKEPVPTPTTWTGNWNYNTPQNAGTPSSGDIIHANTDLTNLHVAKIDDDAIDRGAGLLALDSGDLIEIGGTTWSIQKSSDLGSYVTFQVSPAFQSGSSGRVPVIFETVTATPITYGVDLNYYSTFPQVSGLYIADGSYDDIAVNDNAYGIDIEVQYADLPEDWDVVATSEGAAGASSTGMEEAPEDGFPYVREDAAWNKLNLSLGNYSIINKAADFTLSKAEAKHNPLYLVDNSAGPITITIPTASSGGFALGDIVSFQLTTSTNDVTFVGDTGVTPGGPDLKLLVPRGANSVVSLYYTTNTTATVYGDLRNI